MPVRALPPKPNLSQLRHQAKELLRAHRNRDRDALRRIGFGHPKYSGLTTARIATIDFALADAQLVVARELGFESWPKLKTHVESSPAPDHSRDQNLTEKLDENDSHHPVLSDAQLDAFHRCGIVRLNALLPDDLVSRAQAEAMSALEKRGLRRGGAWCLDSLKDLPAHKAASRMTKAVGQRREFADLMTRELLLAIETILGERPLPMLEAPQALISPPQDVAWTVPHNVWHLDLPTIPNTDIPGVQAFTFLDSVQPHGGGTVAVAGSHRLWDRMKWVGSKQVKRRVQQEPYFRDLMSKDVVDRRRYVEEKTRVGDIDLQVVEIHGEPGDVYLMDLRVLHAPSINATQAPRMMLTHRYIRQQVREYMDEAVSKLRHPDGAQG